MDYNVTEFPKEEFLRLWDIVLIAREGIETPWGPSALYRVSQRIEDFAETDRPAILKPGYSGMYYNDGQIWMNREESFREKQDTALHELAHHEVPHEAHGATWRKVYGTALAFHLRECGESWDAISQLIHTHAVWPYRSFRSEKTSEEKRQAWAEETEAIVQRSKARISTLTERGKR